MNYEKSDGNVNDAQIQLLTTQMRSLRKTSKWMLAMNILMGALVVILMTGRQSNFVQTVLASDGKEGDTQKRDVSDLKKIRCRGLEVIDFSGKTRFQISRGGTMTIFDGNGRERVSCGLIRAGASAGEDSPEFRLLNRNEITQFHFGELMGRSFQILSDEEGKKRMHLSCSQAGYTSIRNFEPEKDAAGP